MCGVAVEVLVLGGTSWVSRSPLPQPRLAPAMVVVANTPRLVGGSYDVAGNVETFPDTVLEYNTDTDTWARVARTRGRSHHAMVTLASSPGTQC